MATFSWLTGVDGGWSMGTNWAGGVSPDDITADVTIDAAGTYTVGIANGESFSVASLLLNQASATLQIDGALNLAGTLTLNAGSLNLGGTINGGTIAATGGTFVAAGGTLNGVTYQGTLDMSGDDPTLTLTGGVSFGGGSTIVLTGYLSRVYVVGPNEVVDNVTIDIGSSWSYGAAVIVRSGDKTTFGPNATIEQIGDFVFLGYVPYVAGDVGDIVNQGSIQADRTGGTFVIDPASFLNDTTGTIAVSSGDNLAVGSTDVATNFTNDGKIDVGSGSTLTFYNGVTNNGTIHSAVGATLSGTIAGGTIAGTLDVTSNSFLAGRVTLTNNVTFTDDSGNLPGAIDVTGYLATLNFGGTQTLENVNVLLGGGADFGYGAAISVTGGTLTIAHSVSIKQAGAGPIAWLGSSPYYQDGDGNIDNHGAIHADFAGGQFVINPGQYSANPASFTNESDGTITVSNGDRLDVATTTSFDNKGSVSVAAGSSLNFSGSLTNDGTISDEAGSSFNFYGDLTNNGTISTSGSGGVLVIDPTHFTNASTGTITISNGYSLSVGNPDGPGIITHTGVTFPTHGVATLFTNDGTIDAGSGSTLLFENGVINHGTIRSVVGTTLAGTIDGGTIAGTLDVTSNSYPDGLVTLRNGVTFTELSGIGRGTIHVTGYLATLRFSGTQTLQKTDILLGGGADFGLGATISVTSLGTLTFAPDVTITQDQSAGPIAWLGSSPWYGDGNGSIVNQGTINADFAGGQFIINPVQFTNDGSIAVSSGDSLTVNSATTNNGTISVAAGSTLDFYGSLINSGSIGTHTEHFRNRFATDAVGVITFRGSVTNDGTIAAAAGDTIEFKGDLTNTGAISAAAGSTIDFQGYLTNDGKLSTDTGSTLSFTGGLNNDGRTLHIAAGTVLSGRINGGTVAGTVDLSADSASLTLTGGVNFTGANGSGPGAIDLTGYLSRLTLDGTETIDTVTIALGSDGGYFGAAIVNTGGGIVTLGAGVTIDQAGKYAWLGRSPKYRGGDGAIVNMGAIVADQSGGGFFIDPTTFTNAGSISVSNGDSLNIGGHTAFTNTGTIGLTGGARFAVFKGATIDVTGDAGITATADSVLYNAGMFEKSGGSGSSTIGARTVNQGSMTIAMGQLDLSGKVTGAGGFSVASGATLQFDGTGNILSGALSGDGAIIFNGGVTALAAGAVLSAADVTLEGAGALLWLGTDLAYSGTLVTTKGTKIKLNSHTLTLSGDTTLAGRLCFGAGTLAMVDDTATLGLGASFSMSHWTISAGSVTLSTNLTYFGDFAADGTTFALGDNVLLLSQSNFTGATISGPGRFSTKGTATVDGLTLDGGAVWVNSGTVALDGSVALGDVTGSAALVNLAVGTIDLRDDSGIAAVNGSNFVNAGLVEKTTGDGVSTIGIALRNTGNIESTAGTLELTGAVSGVGTLTVAGTSTLSLDAGVGKFQTVAFVDAGGRLALNDAQEFAGKITGFGGTDMLDIGGFAAGSTTVSFVQTKASYGTLTVDDSAHPGNHASMILFGQYAAAGFAGADDTHGGTLISYAAPPEPALPVALAHH